MSLPAAAVARPVATVAAVAAALLLGAVTLPQLPVALLPDLPVPVLTIRTRAPEMAASDVARSVAVPIERAIAGLPGLESLRTVSRTGEATTTVVVRWGSDMRRTVWMARERLDAARAHLPAGVERPTLLTSDPGARPIAVLALTAPSQEPVRMAIDHLARMAQTVHAPRLEQLPGIASVVVTGAPHRELAVTLDPERLRTFGLTTTSIAATLRAQNLVGPGGLVRHGALRIPVHAATEFQQIDEVLNAPVGPPGSPVRLRDLGHGQLTRADAETRTRLDGVEAIGLVVYKDAGANTLTVSARLHAELDRLRREFPGYAPTVVATQAHFIRAALDNLGQEIVVGALLSLLLIAGFLRDWRLATAIGCIVPLAVLSAVVLLRSLGVGINVLSLGGLALGTGLLVDTAIVVIESIRRRQEAGEMMPTAAVHGAAEVAAPLVAGTLTTVLVFGPVLLIDGLAAALFRDLALSVVVTSLTSLLLALTLLPVMLVVGAPTRATPMRGTPMRGTPMRRIPARGSRSGALVLPAPQQVAHGRLARWLDHHERAVLWSLAHPRPVLVAALLVLAVTGLLLMRLPRELLPSVEDGVVVADVALPAGSPLATTTQVVARLERTARALGVRRVHARVGVATDEEVLAGAAPGSSATARVLLPVPHGRSAAGLLRGLRLALSDLIASGALTLDPGGYSEFAALFGRETRTVRVLVQAPEDALTRTWSDSVRRWLREIPTLTEVRTAYDTAHPVEVLTLRRDRVARLGLEPSDVSAVLRGLIGVVPGSTVRRTDEQIPIMLRGGSADDRTLDAALRQPVREVPLAQLVTRALRWEPVAVERMDQRPVQVVEAQVLSADLAGTTHRVGQLLNDHRTRHPPPAGVLWRVTGAEADRERNSRQVRTVGFVATVLVFLVLAAEFGNLLTPCVVLLTVPLSVAGALIGLWLTGQSLNVVSLIGMVLLIGMVDNEAVVKLDAIRRHQAAGLPVIDAIQRGSRERVRAILLTALTTIVGVLPLLGGTARGAALYRPLAATLVGGISMAWMVTSYLLPAVYLAVERRRWRG